MGVFLMVVDSAKKHASSICCSNLRKLLKFTDYPSQLLNVRIFIAPKKKKTSNLQVEQHKLTKIVYEKI